MKLIYWMVILEKLYEIQDILKSAFHTPEYKQGLIIFLLQKKWNIIIGEKLFIHTDPEKIYGHKLYVKCSHQGWINTLQFYKKDILKNIKENLEEDFNITDIIFTLGKIRKKDFCGKSIQEENKEVLKSSDLTKENFNNVLDKFLKS
jgi:hypothetical protein